MGLTDLVQIVGLFYLQAGEVATLVLHGLIVAAAAQWIANYIVSQTFPGARGCCLLYSCS